MSKDKKTLVSFPPAKANTYYTMLPPTIETIGKQAFYFVQALENVTIPEKVKKIEDFAFDRVGNLNTIAFLGKTPITDVAASAFNPANVDKTKIDLSVRKDSKGCILIVILYGVSSVPEVSLSSKKLMVLAMVLQNISHCQRRL